MAEGPQLKTGTLPDERLSSYRPLSGMAVACLILGIASVVALAAPILWIVPVAAISMGLLAVRRLRRMGGELSGAALVVAGMGLGVVFGLGGLGAHYIPRWVDMNESRQVATQWLNHLREGDALNAYLLTFPVSGRPPDMATAQLALATDRKSGRKFDKFREKPFVELLTSLGTRASIDFYDMEVFGKIEGRRGAVYVYRVEYTDDEGQPREFLVRIDVVYSYDAVADKGGWWIAQDQAPYVPHSYRPRAVEAHQHDH